MQRRNSGHPRNERLELLAALRQQCGPAGCLRHDCAWPIRPGSRGLAITRLVQVHLAWASGVEHDQSGETFGHGADMKWRRLCDGFAAALAMNPTAHDHSLGTAQKAPTERPIRRNSRTQPPVTRVAALHPTKILPRSERGRARRRCSPPDRDGMSSASAVPLDQCSGSDHRCSLVLRRQTAVAAATRVTIGAGDDGAAARHPVGMAMTKIRAR